MKSLFTTTNIIIALVIAISVIAGCDYVAKQKAKERAAYNNCPYEGLECPNAMQAHYEDSLAYADAEFVIDSLVDANTALHAQLAGCEFQDHSQIPQVAGAGMIHLRHDADGAIELVYREHNGHEYFLDYAVDDFFVEAKYAHK